MAAAGVRVFLTTAGMVQPCPGAEHHEPTPLRSLPLLPPSMMRSGNFCYLRVILKSARLLATSTLLLGR